MENGRPFVIGKTVSGRKFPGMRRKSGSMPSPKPSWKWESTGETWWGFSPRTVPNGLLPTWASSSVRGVSVPIYATNTAKQADYIVDEAEIAVLFVGSKDQYQKAASIIGTSKYLNKIVVFDDSVPLAGSDQAMYFKDFLELGRKSTRDREREERLKNADMNDLATLIYTSGTTGEPKGVMLHHSNFYFSFQAHNKRLAVSDQDISMCFLPLSHVFERT
jgi:long-chain acyl-CoA synthetase